MREIRGEPRGSGRRIAIVAARFNDHITTRLVQGAREALDAHGVAAGDVDLAWVPGAFEIPVVARRFAEAGHHDAVVCLGAVIRGETAHFDLVANEAARGIASVALETGVPVIFEVLATDDVKQAEERSGGRHGNRGWDAAVAALEMAAVLAAVDRGGSSDGRG